MNIDSKIEKMREVFNQVDPAGVFFDDNKDEYDGEIEELIKANIDLDDIEAVNQKINEIFKKYFSGVEIKKEKLDELSFKIQSLLTKYGEPTG